MCRWLAVGLLIAVVCGCSHQRAADSSSADGRGVVVRLIDGDTIVVKLGDTEEHVRLIGIDTPETHKPGTPVECFGPEAADHLAALIPPGTRVRLERDRDTRDVYERLLAYVYRDSDGLFLDLTMVKDGYAGPLAIAPNTAHRSEIDAAAAAARSARLGLWGACGGFHVPGGG